MNKISAEAFVGTMREKRALIERLMRLAATDVEKLPGVERVVTKTPRLFMKHRTPEELGELQHGVESYLTQKKAPFITAAHNAIGKLPGPLQHPTAQNALKRVGETVINNPELLAFELSPLPGSGSILAPAWVGAKRGLERAIDRVAPVPMPKR